MLFCRESAKLSLHFLVLDEPPNLLSGDRLVWLQVDLEQLQKSLHRELVLRGDGNAVRFFCFCGSSIHPCSGRRNRYDRRVNFWDAKIVDVLLPDGARNHRLCRCLVSNPSTSLPLSWRGRCISVVLLTHRRHRPVLSTPAPVMAVILLGTPKRPLVFEYSGRHLAAEGRLGQGNVLSPGVMYSHLAVVGARN